LRGEVARTDALSRWDREVERSAAGVAGGDRIGVRAHREVHPEAEEWHARATRLEPAATDDEPAAGPRRRDTAERQDEGNCRERAIESGREESHGLEGLPQAFEGVGIDRGREARSVVATDRHVGQTRARDG